MAAGAVLRVAVPCAVAALVCAQPAGAGDPAGADALFHEARSRALAGEYAVACREFAESLRLDPAPGTLLNLADCEERAGRLALALEHFLRVEAWVGDREERRETAHERAVALAPRVPALTVTLANGAPDGTRVFRDDVELPAASLSVPLPVEVGSHVILVTAPGHESARFVAVAAERSRSRLEVAPGPVEVSSPPAGLSPGWLVDGAGLVGLGIGAYFGVRALTERSASDATCASGTCTTTAGLTQYEAARSDAVAADVAFGVGLVAVVVGTSLLFVAGHRAPSPVAAMLLQGRVGGAW